MAVDGSPAALKAVDYVGLMEGALIRDLRVTLLFIMSPIPPYLRREGQRNPESFKRLRELESRNRKQAAQVLDKCAERLVRHGLDPEAVEKNPCPAAATRPATSSSRPSRGSTTPWLWAAGASPRPRSCSWAA